MTVASNVGTKGVPRAEREEQILDVATAEFGRRGYATASIAAIAEQAGISKPLIYSYFSSKDGLYLACLDRASAHLTREIRSVLTGAEPNLTLATDTLRVLFAALEVRPHDWNVLYDPTLPADGPVMRAAQHFRGQIAGLATEGVTNLCHAAGCTDPLDISAATQVWMSTVTALVRWWLKHPEHSAEDMARRCDRLAGILVPTR